MEARKFKSKLFTITTIIVIASLNQTVIAGSNSPGIDHRQTNQKIRIGQGVRSGELTTGETLRLGAQQARINRQERRFKSDGNFTKRERLQIHKNQNQASKNIYRKKHNNWN